MIVFLNGALIDAKEAFISPFDRGFLYGDGVFETIRAYKGEPFLLQQHLRRLRHGLNEMNIQLPYNDTEIYHWIKELLLKNNLLENDAYIRITVSRGVTRDLRDFCSALPTIFIYSKPIDVERLLSRKNEGVSAFFVPFCRGYLAELKHLGYIVSLKALLEAENVNDEPIFTNNGKVLEGATSNIFFYDSKKGYVVTPKKGILEGVMRNLLINFMKKEGLVVEERDVLKEETENFSSAFITNSIVEVLGIAQLDDKRYSLEEAKKVNQIFEKYKSYVE